MLGDSEDASIFMIGNPVTHGYMWEKSTDPNWSLAKINWKDCVKEGRMTEEFVREREQEMTTAEFKIWYEAEWPDELQDQLFTSEDLSNISKELTQEELELLTKEPDEKVLGCDIARFGLDFTVLYKVLRYDEKYFIMQAKKFEKKDLMATVGQIVAWDKEVGFDRINIDDSGLGGGVTDRLKEIEQTKTKTFAFIAGENRCAD